MITFLFVTNVLAHFVCIRSTVLDSGLMMFRYNNIPYVAVVEYPIGVDFCTPYKTTDRVLVYVDKLQCLTFRKRLCKEHEYDWHMNIGIKFRIHIYVKNDVYTEELYDWMPVPDLSMVFMSYCIFGFVSTFIYKGLFIKT